MSPTPSPSPAADLSFWPIEATGWATLLTLIVFAVGTVFAYMQLRQAVQGRLASAMADLSRRWDEPLMAESSRLAAALDPDQLQGRIEYLWRNSDPEVDAFMRVPNFFEDLGVMIATGAMPFDPIRRSLGGTVIYEWEHWEPTIMWLRGDEEYDLVYENWEELMKKMRRELRKTDLPNLELDRPDLRYADAEGEAPSGNRESDGP